MQQSDFQQLVWDHYRSNGRDLAWRRTTDPYQIVVSEVMLQQTQVARVQVKFPIFIGQFPNWEALATASVAEVLVAWQGMGYNRRALYLKRLAETVVSDYNGVLPYDEASLRRLPGIGPNTAGSILAFAYNQPTVFIETNVRRVFLHHFFAGETDVPDAQLKPLIAATLDRDNPREWYYALMDYGAHLATTVSNPNRRSRHYSRQPKFEGSDRQLRGAVLRSLVDGAWLSRSALTKSVAATPTRLQPILEALAAEGLVETGPRGCRLVQ